jgi:hypothetical protein
VWDFHELGKGRPPEEHTVCYLEIGYFELHVLGVEIFLSPKCYGKGDLANVGHCYSENYPM